MTNGKGLISLGPMLNFMQSSMFKSIVVLFRSIILCKVECCLDTPSIVSDNSKIY